MSPIKPPPRVVFVVDDERDLAENLAMALGTVPGVEVRVFHDGATAAEALPAAFALFTDLDLPRLSGEELISRFHELRPKAPIAAFSANPEGCAKRVTELGATIFFPKPFSLQVLKQFLKEECDRA